MWRGRWQIVYVILSNICAPEHRPSAHPLIQPLLHPPPPPPEPDFKRMVAMDQLREDGTEEGQNKDQHRHVPPAAFGAPSVHARDLTDSQHTLWGWCHPSLFQKKKFFSPFLYDFMYVCVVWLWVDISWVWLFRLGDEHHLLSSHE